MKDIIGKIWASPNTIVGLFVGLFFYLYSKWKAKKNNTIGPFINIGNNSIQFQFLASPFSTKAHGMCIGNVTFYFYLTAMATVNTYDRKSQVNVGRHERVHTYQYQKYGPFFVFVYFWRGGAKASNPMEQEADRVRY